MDLRGRQSLIKDQGRRGTCVAFAATAGHEMLRSDGEELCLEFLHWAAKRRDGLPKAVEGTTLAAAGEALAHLGQPPEELWPYDDQRDQWAATYCPPARARRAARRRRLTGGTALVLTPVALCAALDARQAVLLGIRLYVTWHTTSSDGWIQMPTATAASLGAHAVLLVGFEDGTGAGGGHFIVRNSWGRDWGDEGYGYLPYGYVDAYGLQAWSLTT